MCQFVENKHLFPHFRFIDAVELRKCLQALGFKLGKEEARRMIMDISVKGKG